MRTGSELLGHDSEALIPLSATLVARPTRVCVFVGLQPDVSWMISVEHALACQTRYWGGDGNLIVPLFDGVGESELLWRVLRAYDADVLGIHMPTTNDAQEMVPDLHETVIARRRANLEADEVINIDDYLTQLGRQPFWNIALPKDLEAAIVRWAAPFHHRTSTRSIVINGSDKPHDLTDAVQLAGTEQMFANLTSLVPVDQLLLTSSIGRFTRRTVELLASREVVVRTAEVQSPDLALNLWPRETTTIPWSLAQTGLAYRLGRRFFDAPAVIAGDKPEDWFLYNSLRVLRPNVFWLPESKLDDEPFVRGLRNAVWMVSRSAGATEPISVLSVESPEAATRAADAVLAPRFAGEGIAAAVADWRSAIPESAYWAVDPRSVRNAPLLVSGGETDELPTPTPLATRAADQLSNGWVVEVDVRDWPCPRHPALGSLVLPGGFSSTHDQRIGRGGPSYFGLSGFIQHGLGIEHALSRRHLSPIPVLEALSLILGTAGWSVCLSDKGAYTQRTTQLLGGVEKAVSELRRPETRALFDVYVARERSASIGLFLADTRRRYLSLSEASSAIGRDAEDLLNHLYDRDILTRGHVLKCVRCRATSFYSLDAQQQFTCRRCRYTQRATRYSWLGEAEPAFRYELDETVFQFLDNDCEVPLLAAYDFFVTRLGADDRRSVDLGFEFEVISPDGQKSEHDVVAAWGPDLWLGEATTKADLGPKESVRIRRLKELADVATARGVLFATTTGFSDKTRERIAAVFTPWPGAEPTFVESLPLVEAGAAG